MEGKGGYHAVPPPGEWDEEGGEPEEAEGKRRANPFDTVVEGVGLNRLTANFALVAMALHARLASPISVSLDTSHPRACWHALYCKPHCHPLRRLSTNTSKRSR